MGLSADARTVVVLRELRGLTQDDLASIAGYSDRTIRRVESGQSVSPQVLLDIAAALDTEVNEILSEDGRALSITLQKQIVREFLEAMDQQDISVALGRVSEYIEVVWSGPLSLPFVGVHHGKSEFERAIRRHRDLLETDNVGERSLVATEAKTVIVTGKKLLRVKGNCVQGEAPYCLVCDITNRLIHRLECIIDYSALFSPLPLLVDPARADEEGH